MICGRWVGWGGCGGGGFIFLHKGTAIYDAKCAKFFGSAKTDPLPKPNAKPKGKGKAKAKGKASKAKNDGDDDVAPGSPVPPPPGSPGKTGEDDKLSNWDSNYGGDGDGGEEKK